MESSATTVVNGVATVKLSCNLQATCRGAVLICLPDRICSFGPTRAEDIGGRLAGSDLAVPPGQTSEVGIGLTTLGKQVASGPGGFTAVVFVQLTDYGVISQPTLRLASADAPEYPAGATASCGGIVFVGPGTSCAFAKNVEKAYVAAIKMADGPDMSISATSPVTGKTYQLHCTGESPARCQGGTNALVELY